MNRKLSSKGSIWEVLWVAARLGMTSFGGPVAHIGYFREEYVVRKRWLSDREFAEYVSLCQFLPGPASSQLGMAIGAQRAGVLGALAAWFGFTMPSALLMIAFAFGMNAMALTDAGWLQGLKLAAVAIVAQAVWSMARSLAPDRIRGTLALASAAFAILVGGIWGQLVPLLICAVIGILWLRSKATEKATADEQKHEAPAAISRKISVLALVIFASLLLLLPFLSRMTSIPVLSMVDNQYRAGSLVFGGGHVVLPMLEEQFIGNGELQLTTEQFMSGYGAVQAVPGPLFTFAAYIGASAQEGFMRIVYGFIALCAIFLPAFLLLIGTMSFWHTLKKNLRAQAALYGVNASIVGILLAALYDPIFIGSIQSPQEFVFALLLFAILQLWKRPAWQVVLAAAVAGLLLL